jgi:hypothetical protein
MNLRLGPVAVTVIWSPVSYGWPCVYRWTCGPRVKSWRHGSAYWWRVKVVW